MISSDFIAGCLTAPVRELTEKRQKIEARNAKLAARRGSKQTAFIKIFGQYTQARNRLASAPYHSFFKEYKRRRAAGEAGLTWSKCLYEHGVLTAEQYAEWNELFASIPSGVVFELTYSQVSRLDSRFHRAFLDFKNEREAGKCSRWLEWLSARGISKVSEMKKYLEERENDQA